MDISNALLIAIATTLAAAAAALCCLLANLVLDLFSLVVKEYRKKRVTDRRLEERLERELLARQREIIDRMGAQTELSVAAMLEKIEQQHSETLSQLKQALKEDHQKNSRELEAVTEGYLGETKIALNGLVRAAEKRVDNELTKQLQAAQSEIKEYKGRQIQKIDRQITTIVEKTIYKTLGKGLTLEDHIDIIYKSLAEAKEEGFFTNHAQ